MKWEENVRKVVPYVAGEQPNRPNMIKLNTNECPYPPAPGVRQAAENMESASLRLYPNSNAQPLVDALAAYYHVKPEQVFVGVGSDDVLSMAFLTFFNSGKPIPEEDVPKLWDKFYKVDKAHTREYGGNGIGLSIVKAIMESFHQGYGVRNFDNGVEFWFELDAKS